MKTITHFFSAFIILIATCLITTAAQARQLSGSGTSGDPYQVGTAAELDSVRNYLNDAAVHFVLTSDIDLDISPYNTGSGWEPIGDDSDQFTGTFKGKEYTVSNLFIDRDSESYMGLFGYLGSGGVIDSIGVENAEVTGEDYIGVLVGYSEGGTISYSYATGSVTGDQAVGGLAGRNYTGGIIEFCYTSVRVSSTGQSSGGIAGRNNASTIRYSFSTDSVISSSSTIGGITGKNTSSSTISNSYSTAYVFGSSQIGGVVGKNNNSTVSNSYSIGTISGGSQIGGLIGNNNSTVTDSYWDTEASGNASSAGGTGKTTSEMKEEATFSGWDFSTIWDITEGSSYPFLIDNEPDIVAGFEFPFQSGAGTTDDPFSIATPEHLDSVRLYLDYHFKLNADLDMDISPYNTGSGWEPIGDKDGGFEGSLNGSGFVINNLFIDRSSQDSVGLFGVLASGSSIEKLSLIDISISGDADVGGLVGYNDNASVSNTYVTGELTGSSDNIGGLAGTNTGTVDTTYASVVINGSGSNIGGLVGTNNGTVTVSNWNTDISGLENGIGGGSSTTGTTGLNSNFMKRQANFDPDWFTNTWTMTERGSYPYLNGSSPSPLPGASDFSYAEGYGTKADPYQISTNEELDSLRVYTSLDNTYYVLTTDLDLDVSPYNSGAGWEPVGDRDDAFKGTINGAGHKISGLMINRSSEDYIGLFGALSGRVDSLWIDNASITGNKSVGSLAGVSTDTVRHVFTTGSITASSDSVGGIIGINEGLISTSYTLLEVSGSNIVGGLTGFNSGSVDTSYAAGDVTGSGNNIGGLIGLSDGGSASTSYWNKNRTAQIDSDGGTGLTTSESKEEANFVDWNFTTTWSITEGSSYPYQTIYTTSPLPGVGIIFGGAGSGTSEDPYIIISVEGLNTLKDSLTAHFRMGKDIDLSFYSDWSPIGSTSKPFEGSFDGDGYVITGLTINSSGNHKGLFGALGDAVIDSVWLEDVNITANNFVGALVGSVQSGNNLISNSYSTGNVTGNNYVGGLIGWHFDATVTKSYSKVDVTSSGYPTGGFAGENDRGDIDHSYATGDVTSTSTDDDAATGGFVGLNAHRGDIHYSYATGDVTSAGGSGDANSGFVPNGTGGFAGATGEINQTTSNNISNSYATGKVTTTKSNPNIGGFAGTQEDGTVSSSFSTGLVDASGTYANGFIGRISDGTSSNNYWNTETSGKSSGGTGSGLTTSEMKDSTNFTGFDFDDTWSSISGVSFPFLEEVGKNRVTVREITGTEGWRMFSAGFDGLSYGELLEDLWTQGFTGSDGEGDVSNVYTWNGSSFVSISDASDMPEPGSGFIVYVYDDDDNDESPEGFPKSFQVQGDYRSGPVSPTLTNTGDGWNLLGNPFVSVIDWDAPSGWSASNLDATFYVWSDSAGGSGAYLTWNGITGTKGNGIIAPGQGFWVKANADGPSLSIDESVKSDSSAVLLKKAIVPEITLTIKSDTYSSKAILMFHENASEGAGPLDAYSLSSLSNEWISISTESATGEALSINALPSGVEEKIIIPLYTLGRGVPDIATLSFSGLENFEGWEIEMVDTQTGERFDVFTYSDIVVDVEILKVKEVPQLSLPTPVPVKTKTNAARYQLHLTQDPPINNESINDTPKVVALDQNYPNPFNPSTTINYEVPQQSNIRLEVFNLLGQKVMTLVDEPKATGRYSTRFDAGLLSSGVYIYRLQVGSTILNKKMTLIK